MLNLRELTPILVKGGEQIWPGVFARFGKLLNFETPFFDARQMYQKFGQLFFVVTARDQIGRIWEKSD